LIARHGAPAPAEPRRLEIGSTRVGIDEVVAVARGEARVHLGEAVIARLERARAVVDRHAAGDAPIYGLTTGLGAAVDTRVPSEDAEAFQRRVIMGRAVGVGDPLPAADVRAMLFARLAGLAYGASGISPAVVLAVAAMLDAGVHPLVRALGTLGEADLSPLSQAFLPLVGAGEAEWQGECLPGGEALRRAGIAPPALAPKDGIALLNANALSAGLGALAVHELALVIDALTVSGALALEGFRANLSPLDARLVALRPAVGQELGAQRLRTLLHGSDLFEPGRARRVQDPLSFRCLSPVHGAAFEHLSAARAAVEIELNSGGDSPAVLIATGEMLSTVNFDTTALALSFESVGLAAAHAAALAVFRVSKLMSPVHAELPRFLTSHGGSRTGFATAQKTAAALESDIRRLAQPAGAMAAPVADGVEDYAPMTPLVIAKTRDIARRLARLAAVELVVAAQAIDLRGTIRLGRGTKLAHAFVRGRVPRLDDDRPMGREFELLAQAIEAGDLARVLAEVGTA
jgi:histidine ammonia-lyase